MTAAAELKPKKTWRESFAAYRDRRVMGMLLLGFSAGLPIALIFATLSRWLAEEKVSLANIGLFSLTGLAYGFKFCWAPLVDHLPLPVLHNWLGRRRSWICFAQIGCAIGLLGMAFTDPKAELWTMAMFAVVVGFSSATQDIAIDAWRIETAPDETMLGALAGAYQLGYRIALLIAGAGVFVLVEVLQNNQVRWAWPAAYLAMAAFMLISIASTLWVKEPESRKAAMPAQWGEQGLGARIAYWFANAIVNPFVEFFTRNRAWGIVILAFIACFWMSDRVWGVMAQPFYEKLGFDKIEIAVLSKTIGLWVTLVGALVGSLIVTRWGIMGPLLMSAVLIATTNLLFALLATQGKSTILLGLVITAENLSGGMAGTVFIAYLSSLTNVAYTGTQYALFSSLMVLPGKMLAGASGFIVESIGYPMFFVYTSAMGIPAILLILVLMAHARREKARAAVPAGAAMRPRAAE
jgi:MFS transporter, PAT family, beta-lactamase induction signal transducer AmpG